jgi:hypothetical protein
MADPEPTPDPTPAPSPEPTPSPTPSPDPTPGDWRASLGTDLAKEKFFDSIKAKDATEALPLIAKRAVDANKMIGNSIQLPAKDAKPEEIAKWREAQFPKLVAAGLVQAPPAAASEYTLTAPDLPNLPPLSETRADFYKSGFHKLGISQAQAQGILELHAQEISQGLHLLDTANQKEIDGVAERWGEPLFNKRWAAANDVIPTLAEAVGLDKAEVTKYLEATRKGNDPILFQLLAAVGEVVGEDVVFTGKGLGVSGVEEAKQRIAAIRENPAHAWHNENHPDHAKARTEMEGLYKMVYGTQSGLPK